MLAGTAVATIVLRDQVMPKEISSVAGATQVFAIVLILGLGISGASKKVLTMGSRRRNTAGLPIAADWHKDSKHQPDRSPCSGSHRERHPRP